MPEYSTASIAAEEYRAISGYAAKEMERLRSGAHGGPLRALIAFGDFVRYDQSRHADPSCDIVLLEVVEGWQGRRSIVLTSTPDLPLRGRLQVSFLLPAEFERPSEAVIPGETWSSARLLAQVHQAYAVVLEGPEGYATGILSRLGEPPVILSATGLPLRRGW